MEQVILVSAVIGAVEFVKRAFDKDWRTMAIIAVAGLVGAVFGPEFGLTTLEGAVAGLSASGAVTFAQNV